MKRRTTPRVAFFTIGQSPRTDVVPEMVQELGGNVRIDEYGALDGLSDADIAGMAPQEGRYRFATRLADGRQVQLDSQAAESRLEDLMRSVDDGRYDVLVPLCTGTAIAPMKTLVLEPQQIVDHALAGIARHCRRIGILVPLASQLEAFHMVVELSCEIRLVHASPYESGAEKARDSFVRAGQALRDCDLILMHCMGYSAWMRDVVAMTSGRPALLSNRIVSQLLSQTLT